MVELVDTTDLKSVALAYAGSNPAEGTIFMQNEWQILVNRFHSKWPNECVEFVQGHIKGGEPVKYWPAYRKPGESGEPRWMTPEKSDYFYIQAGDQGYGDWMYTNTEPTVEAVFEHFNNWLKERDL